MTSLVVSVDRRGSMSAEVLVDAPASELRARLASVPLRARRFRLVASMDGSAVLERRIGWATWGDRFALEWQPADGGTVLRITSVKRFPTAFGDHGQGPRDLRVLTDALAGIGSR